MVSRDRDTKKRGGLLSRMFSFPCPGLWGKTTSVEDEMMWFVVVTDVVVTDVVVLPFPLFVSGGRERAL